MSATEPNPKGYLPGAGGPTMSTATKVVATTVVLSVAAVLFLVVNLAAI